MSVYLPLASFPGPKKRRKGLVSAVRACALRILLVYFRTLCLYRAGGNGTAGTAMAVTVFEGKKMASLGF